MINGEFLYRKRIEIGLSQSQVANELGYSVQLISLWESGKNTPSITVLGKYAALLHIDLEGIIYSKDIKKNDHCDNNSFNQNEFGKYLKKLRKKKGITQKELAKEVSCPTNAIIRFEKAASVPNLEQLIKLAEYFNISIDELYFATSFVQPIIPKVKKTKIPLPILLPIVITVTVGGGVTGTVVGVTNLNAKKLKQDDDVAINNENNENIDNQILDDNISNDDNNTSQTTNNNGSTITESPLTTDYLSFGLYPQSRVTDESLFNSLNTISESNSLGYYVYQDNQYAKIEAFYNDIYTVDVDAGFYFDNNERIVDSQVYWFKVEPIKWDVLSENDNEYLLLSSLIIDAHLYDEDSSIYESSSIRSWLNNDFYNKAFFGITDKVSLMEVDNSLESTGLTSNPYISSNTSDYVSLLSNEEIKNTEYKIDRTCSTTEYCRAIGGASNVDKNGPYWLRSPDNSGSNKVQVINGVGKVYVKNDSYRPTVGVRPIITIKK